MDLNGLDFWHETVIFIMHIILTGETECTSMYLLTNQTLDMESHTVLNSGNVYDEMTVWPDVLSTYLIITGSLERV